MKCYFCRVGNLQVRTDDERTKEKIHWCTKCYKVLPTTREVDQVYYPQFSSPMNPGKALVLGHGRSLYTEDLNLKEFDVILTAHDLCGLSEDTPNVLKCSCEDVPDCDIYLYHHESEKEKVGKFGGKLVRVMLTSRLYTGLSCIDYLCQIGYRDITLRGQDLGDDYVKDKFFVVCALANILRTYKDLIISTNSSTFSNHVVKAKELIENDNRYVDYTSYI